jgi:hypothetical protein
MLTNLIIAGVIITLIFVVGLGKQFLDTKCQENFDCGMKFGKMIANAINKYEEGK